MMRSSTSIDVQYRDFRFALTFIDLCERSNAAQIAIEIEADFSGQQLRYQSNNSWFEYSALDSFASSLREDGPAILVDQSEYPILEIARIETIDWLSLHPRAERESSKASQLRFVVQLPAGFSNKLWQAFDDFPKWW